MKRVVAFRLLYLGAWVAGMELGFELILPLALGPLPAFVIYAARGMQLAGIAAAVLGAVNLARPATPPAPASASSQLDALLHADRIMRAYLRDVLEHLLFAGLVLSLLLVYGWALYLRVLRYEDARWWYYGVLLASLVSLIGTWLLSVVRIMREEKRLRQKPTEPIAA